MQFLEHFLELSVHLCNFLLILAFEVFETLVRLLSQLFPVLNQLALDLLNLLLECGFLLQVGLLLLLDELINVLSAFLEQLFF